MYVIFKCILAILVQFLKIIIYKFVLVSGVKQGDSVIHTYINTVFFIFFSIIV